MERISQEANEASPFPKTRELTLYERHAPVAPAGAYLSYRSLVANQEAL